MCSLTYLHKQLKSEIMDKNELFEIIDQMKETFGSEWLLEEICRGLSSENLENELRFIDRVYETNLFND